MTRGLRHPPFAKPGAPMQKTAHAEEQPQPAGEQLRPIEEFLDDLPSIDDFLAFDDYSETEPAEAQQELVRYAEAARAPGEAGWADGDWQSYDWSSAASLNRSSSSALDSSDAWSESDWPDPVSYASIRRGSDAPSADEIANALDGIAHRIRSGELVIDNLQGTPPEAAMAAALAVLLRMRG